MRLSAIGDVLHGLPVLNALRNALPKAFLAWVVEGRAAQLLRGHRALDELIEVPRGWLKSPRAVLDLRRKLRLTALRRRDRSARTEQKRDRRTALGAPRRIGFDGVDGREISRWLNNERVEATRTHVIDRNLELLGRLGISHPAVRFDLADTAATASAVDKMLESLRPRESFAVINPGAGWNSKLWPAARYGAVARHLGQVARLEVSGRVGRRSGARLGRRNRRRLGRSRFTRAIRPACRNWRRWCGGQCCSSAPTRARCIWRPRWARLASACSALRRENATARTARCTSRCKRFGCLAPARSGERPAEMRWPPSRSTTCAPRATGFSIACRLS